MSRDDAPREAGRFVAGHHYGEATEFKSGVGGPGVATRFATGARRGLATEFKPGQPARNRRPVGTVCVRIETHTGLPRAWIKVAEPDVWRKRAVVVWETVHGPLPRGYVVHHKDRDSLNDAPSNLVGLTRKEHSREHREEMVAGMARAVFGRGWVS